MASSTWLILTMKPGQQTLQAFVSSAIPRTGYVDRGYSMRYVSLLNPRAFSGDILVLDVHRKPLYSYTFTDGAVDSLREPLSLRIVRKLLTKNITEEEHLLDEVVVIGHRPDPPYTPNPMDDFCLYYPELCDIGGSGGSGGGDPSGGSDGPPPTGGSDGSDDGSGGGSTGSNIPANQRTTNVLKDVNNAKLKAAVLSTLVKMPERLLQILDKFSLKIQFTRNPLARNIEGTIKLDRINGNSIELVINELVLEKKDVNENYVSHMLIHEFAHVVVWELGFRHDPNPNHNLRNDNEYQHRHMVDDIPQAAIEAGLTQEDLLRARFPDEADDFLSFPQI